MLALLGTTDREIAGEPGEVHIPGADFEAFLARCASRYAWMSAALLRDYARNYGTQIATF